MMFLTYIYLKYVYIQSALIIKYTKYGEQTTIILGREL